MRTSFLILMLVASTVLSQEPKALPTGKVAQNPSGSAEPAQIQSGEGTSTASSQDGIRYAASCPGHDIGARINACIDSLPTAPDGHKVGLIMLPNTMRNRTLAAWSTEVHMSSGISLKGQGTGVSQFTCTALVCLFMDEHEREGSKTRFSFALERSDTLSDFSLNGSNLPNQEVILIWDRINLTMAHVHVDQSNGPGGSCIHLESHDYWTERNAFTDITTGYACRIAWRLTNDPSNRNALPSFGFNRFSDIRMNVGDSDGFGQRGFSIEDKVYFYNSFIGLIVNAAGSKYSELFHLQDEAKVFFDTLNVDGEGGLKYIVNLASPTTGFIYYGHLNLVGKGYHVSPGAFFVHYADDGGNGPPVPITFSNGVQSLEAIQLPPGTNLDSVTSCGYSVGRELRNAPAPLGSRSIRIQTVCTGGTNMYLTQIAYQMEDTGGKPRVWQRVRDAGAWGQWREQAWEDQSWHSKPVPNHIVCVKAAGPPVDLGYCSTDPDSSGTCACR